MPLSLWSWFGLLCSKARYREISFRLLAQTLTYFSMLNISQHHSSDLSDVSQKNEFLWGRRELIEKWLKEDKLECTEELGDIVRPLETKCLGAHRGFSSIQLMSFLLIPESEAQVPLASILNTFKGADKWTLKQTDPLRTLFTRVKHRTFQ